MKTIYDVHGIGDAALDGLRAATGRIQEAVRRLRVQPPAPIPEIPVLAPEDLPELPSLRGQGLTWSGGRPEMLGTDKRGRRAVGAITAYILRELNPTELLQVTEAAEEAASQYEALATEREQEIDQAIRRALDDSDPAIRELAERIIAAAEADQDRIEWIREHGSPRLRRLLEEGIEHGAVYRDERLAMERPGWRYNEHWIAQEPRNAPMKALELLDDARQTAPDARLVYWTATLPCDDCEDEDDCYCEVEEVRGYTCEAEFLGRKIVYRVEDDGTPPVLAE